MSSKLSIYYTPTITKYLELFRENPTKYSVPIDDKLKALVLRDYDWFKKNYIIDLNKDIDFDAFSHKNFKYMYTPKIYKIGSSMFVERTMPICPLIKAYNKDEVFKILISLLYVEIGVELVPSTITVFKQKEFKRIKFNRFYHCDCDTLDLTNYYSQQLEDIYKT